MDRHVLAWRGPAALVRAARGQGRPSALVRTEAPGAHEIPWARPGAAAHPRAGPHPDAAVPASCAVCRVRGAVRRRRGAVLVPAVRASAPVDQRGSGRVPGRASWAAMIRQECRVRALRRRGVVRVRILGLRGRGGRVNRAVRVRVPVFGVRGIVLGCWGVRSRVWDRWRPVSAGCRGCRWSVLVMWDLRGRWGRVSCAVRIRVPVVQGGCLVRIRVPAVRGGFPGLMFRVRLSWWAFRACACWRGPPVGRMARASRVARSRAVRRRDAGWRWRVQVLGEPVWGSLVLVRAGPAGPATTWGGSRVPPGGMRLAGAGCGRVRGRMVVAGSPGVQVWRRSARGGCLIRLTGALMPADLRWCRASGDHPRGGPRRRQAGSTASNALANPLK